MKRYFFFLSFLFSFNIACLASPVDSISGWLKELNGIRENDSALVAKINDLIVTGPYDTFQLKSMEKDIRDAFAVRPNDALYVLLYKVYEHLNENGYRYLAIDKNKALVEELKNYKNPYQKYVLLITLSELRIPYRNSDRINEGIEYFLQLVSFYESKNDSQAISVCYYVLRGLINTIGLQDKSIYYQQKSIQYLNPDELYRHNFILFAWPPNIGVIGAVNRKAVLGSLLLDEGEAAKALPYLYEAKRMYEKYKDSVFMADGPFVFLQILRANMFLRTDSVKYYLDIVDTFAGSNVIYKAVFFQEKGYYFFQENQLDSAEIYYQKAFRLRDTNNLGINTFAGIIIPGYYLAKVKQQQKKYGEAITLLLTEIEQLKAINLRKTILKELNLLASIYNDAGEYKNASLTQQEYINLHAAILKDEARNRSMTFELEQSIIKKEKDMKALAVENEFNRKSKYYLLGIAILIALIAIGLFARYLTKQKANKELEAKNIIITQEKERSDELLLNILPSDVAEELKAKGSAAAKQFDDVTVMFTDFKNFTRISEKLSPSELVAEIDTCFRAFDNIITGYSIEKIKTIGDSYMCVGGLPKTNSTHAENVVNAALDILEFMKRHNKEKEAKGDLVFEIRIGINTGTVVAGIVGVKKFAYDIWGDTVNIASRLESSGEAGKINISGSTYELVKDKFACTHRGKIQAKNKGDVDMYFVERV